ncbi:MAG: nuclear transport factor 2 family protein [Methanobacterium sp.]
MTVSLKYVEDLFNYLQIGENGKFFEKVADNVNWTVMGTHPLAGVYKNKQEFVYKTFIRLNKLLKEEIILKINNIIIQADNAVVEMISISTALNGMPFNNTYCWIVKFENGIIVNIRAYVDSALVQKIIDENETPIQ